MLSRTEEIRQQEAAAHGEKASQLYELMREIKRLQRRIKCSSASALSDEPSIIEMQATMTKMLSTARSVKLRVMSDPPEINVFGDTNGT